LSGRDSLRSIEDSETISKMNATSPHSDFVPRLPFWLSCLAALLLTSCDSEKRAASALISDRGVEVSEDALFDALDSGDVSLAVALVISDVDPDARDSMERTPVMMAAGGKGASLVPLLAAEGADLEATDATGRTALSHAVEAGNLAGVVALLKEAVSPSVDVDTGGTLVAQALRQHRQAAVALLLAAGADPNSKGALGESLVEIAVEEGHLVTLIDLAERGVDLHSSSKDGKGLLHLSLENDHDEIFTFLLESGVDPNGKNERGETLVQAVATTSKLHLLPELKKHGSSFDALDPRGWSPVHLAILARDHELLNTLLNLGADVDQYSRQENQSIAPLTLAIENRLFSMAGLLLRYGAKPRDEMYQAVKRGGRDGLHLIKLLLENGASPSPSRAPSLDSPIGLAVRNDEYEIAKALLDAGASHEVHDLCGQKPLHVAVARGHSDMVGLLLDKGADPDEPFQAKLSESFLDLINSDGIGRWALKKSTTFYPIMLASDSGNVEIAQQLIDHGANPARSTKVGSYRMWPLTFATRRSDIKMMQVVLGRKPGKSNLWIKVDLSEQRAYVYKDGEQVYQTRVSTGKQGYRTRPGKFVITNKYRDWKSTIYDSPMPYFQRLSASDFGFHVGHVPSYPASHGCIRMPSSAAKKLFGMTKVGDYVEIVP
jgi:ankyrin repeat protein